MSSRQKTFYEQELERLYNEVLPSPKQFALIRQSRSFMQKYHSENVVLDDLAKASFMSRFHYVRMFKQIYGVTPRAHLKDMRIDRAKLLLQQGQSITKTCFDVGYESLTTFSAVFKKSTGYSPKAFQQLHTPRKNDAR
ncbi:helix-turn-helix transcriptional regulator [Shewanella sp. WXL01]|uniref:helix-turn-helix transcriptional regulator n=1 Tax=Shewanella sp. WXL01 TaxID=2709721 RepID=UPI0014384CC8|nr:helix-turn-helix transcriptional regulator [Shewanella sp. WXL01]NKF48993.1 helix-turn-helix transcriptional regulator [Shewanella sp. WXL01]